MLKNRLLKWRAFSPSMKIKKILITFSFLVFFSLIVESICPKIVIYGAPNIKAKVQVVMDFYDKYYDGDVSLHTAFKKGHWSVEKGTFGVQKRTA